MPNELSVVEQIGASVKTFFSRGEFKATPFSRHGGDSGSGIYGGVYDGGTLFGRQPGASYDYRTAAGVLHENSVVATCVDTIAQALSDAPAMLEKRTGNEWERVGEHPAIDLLTTPNDYYGSSHLWNSTAMSESTTGNAFWRGVWARDKSGIEELHWEPAKSISMKYDANAFISNYVLRVDGQPYELQAAANVARTGRADDRDVIIHFRHSLNPNNPRWGWTPLETVYRQVAGDNGAATYHGALLRNSAVASLLISIKDAAGSDQVTPEQFDTFVKALRDKLSGEGAGNIAGVNLPLDVAKLGFSPDELALDKLIAYYESRICAALKVPAMMLGLSSGESTKTYANLGEAIKDFWERTIQPMQSRHARELGTQLLPLFGLNPSEYRINWDYSNVGALQESQDELYARLGKAVGGPFMTPNEARARVQLQDVPEGDVVRAAAVPDKPEESQDNASPKAETKSMENKSEELTPESLAFTDEELDALTNDLGAEDIKMALAKATPEKRELLKAEQINTDDKA